MACASLTALARVCGPEGIAGGLSKLYAMAFADAENIGATDSVYAKSVSGIVNDIGIATGKNFVEIGLLPSTAGINEELTKNLQTGTAFLTQTSTLVIPGLTAEVKTWIENVINQPVIIVVKTRNGNYYAAGLDGQLELATLSGGTGIAEGDLVGYTLTFTGISASLIPMVDPTIIPTILAPAA